MTIANVKSTAVKALMALTAAAALMFASAPKAQAQGFAVGVEVGYPHYDYARHDRFEFERREAFVRQQEFERRQAFLRHQEWERDHRFARPYGFGPRY